MKDSNGKFIGFTSPRYTQVPDELFDELLSVLSGAELKVLLYVVRRTFGFKRDSDHISLSQMTNGIRRKNGDILDKGTGLDKKTVIRSVKALVSKKILVHTKKSSPEKGYESSEYALNLRKNPLWHKATSPHVGKAPQALVAESHIQETDKQHTDITLEKYTNESTADHKSTEKSRDPEREYLARQILSICRDQKSLAFYRKVVRLLPKQVVFETLSRVKEAQVLGRIKDSPGAMFTDLIKRKAQELGIEFCKESRETATVSGEPGRDRREFNTPAEIMMAGRGGRR